MIIVILKTGYAFGFEMASWEKEKMLVQRFSSGGLSQTTTLDLKSKGEFKVSEIEGMEFQPVKVIKKEEPEESKKAKNEKKQEDNLDAFRQAMRDHRAKNKS